MHRQLISNILRTITELLAQKDYAAIETMTRGVRLSAAEIAQGVDNYGMTIVVPLDDSHSQPDIIQVAGTKRPTYSVRLRLHTKEEGLSDIELQATIICSHEDGEFAVELDNIVVA